MNTLKTLSQFSEDNPAFSVRKLRWIDQRSREVTDQDYRKFAPAFIGIGRSRFIDEAKFLAIAKGEA